MRYGNARATHSWIYIGGKVALARNENLASIISFASSLGFLAGCRIWYRPNCACFVAAL